MSTVLNSGAVLHQVSCLFSFVSVCDAFQEQYELVYQAVLELFKRQMDVIRDQHLGTEVSIQPDIVSLFFFVFDFGQGISDQLQDSVFIVRTKLERQWCMGLHCKSPVEKDGLIEVLQLRK